MMNEPGGPNVSACNCGNPEWHTPGCTIFLAGDGTNDPAYEAEQTIREALRRIPVLAAMGDSGYSKLRGLVEDANTALDALAALASPEARP